MTSPIPGSMRAWRVERLGALELRRIAVPTAEPGSYLVRVEAAGLAFGDTLLLHGAYQTKPALPFTLGSEVVGTVVSSGGPVPAGTRIAGSCRLGAFAEYALVPHESAIEVDADISAAVALALRGNYPTSLHALRNVAALQEGETLLVHAGAGGVGSAAVQLGKVLGARVIAVAGGERKMRACHDLGADEVLDSGGSWIESLKVLAPSGVDVIFDPVGGPTGALGLRALAYGARYLVIGFAGGELTQLPANRLLLRNASALGVLWGEVVRRDPVFAAALNSEVFAWHARGLLRPLRGPLHRFEQANEALRMLQGRGSIGKVVLQIATQDDNGPADDAALPL